ncbi:hypothetical protein NC799_17950 [Aquibacillus sp. 3ASR75-54]|uniref:ATP-dependent DNA helicase RecG C-terminal domain-containing protein n=1 Tax=Aquibacillus salsiterrae TaxID=2950439 RepID=A0A9X3WF78_9BACI|nr:hypothetical protein [Aquibacillus salsiterrae]
MLNTLIHANYFAEVGIVIEKEKSFFRFSNPGILRIPYEKAIEGGNSDPRNPFLFKMFSQLGLGERSGYGLENIHTTWRQQHWKMPALQEEFQPERTTLTLLTTSLLPDDIVKFIKFSLKDRYHLLSPDEVLILVTAYQEKSVTNVRLQTLTNKYAQDINKLLTNFVHEGLLETQGAGRGTEYILSEVFKPSQEIFDYIQQSNHSEKSEIQGNHEINLGNKEKILGNFSESYNQLLAIAKPARENARLKPVIMRELILSLCKEQFLSLNELSELLNREAS